MQISALYAQPLCCGSNVEPTLSLQNFNAIPITSYPVGVFNIVGTYLGDAQDQYQYANLWNGNPANAQKATIFVHPSNPFTFRVFYNDPTFTGPLSALNYFNATFASTGSLTLNLDNNAVVKDTGNSNVFYANNYSLVPSSTNLFNNFNSPYKWNVIPAFNYRNMAITNYSGKVLNVYHNQSDIVFAHEYPNMLKSVSGALPTGLKYYFSSGNTLLDYNSYTNVSNLTNLLWWTTDHFGGGGNLFLSKINANLANLHQLKGLWLGELGSMTNTYTLTWINATNFPVLSDLLISQSLTITTYDATWWGNLPKVTNLMEIRLNSTGIGATLSDQVWNGMGTLLGNTTPTGATNTILITGTSTVTSASLTARNNLIARGWTLNFA